MALLVAAVALIGTESATAAPPRSVTARLADLERLPPAAACDGLELLLSEDLSESDRRACLRALRARIVNAAPALSPVEQDEVNRLRRDNPAGTELLLGRYIIVLATPKFAARARVNGFVPTMDLAYVLLRDLFAVDPCKIVGHRFISFPKEDKPGGHTTNTQTLRIMIGRADWDGADWFERYFHEMSHPFINLQPLEHVRCSGFGEGWAEFCQAYVPERLEFLGEPFAKRFDYYIREFRECGQREYLQTRLPIEEIVSYGPSSSFLMAVTLTTRSGSRGVDWSPWKKLFRHAAGTPPPRMPIWTWPLALERDVLRHFDAEAVRPLLRRYRFPPESGVAELDRAAKQLPAGEFDCKKQAALWADDNWTVVRDWKVLGPFPDPSGRRLLLDPIDEWNFERRDKYDYDGRTWTWRSRLSIDPCGTVHLGQLPGGSDPCVFYLLATIKAEPDKPLTLMIGSDDDTVVWIDGRRVHVFWGNRGVDIVSPDLAIAPPGPGERVLLMKVANHGGSSGAHLRYRSGDIFEPYLSRELAADAGSRRAAAVDYLGARRVPGEMVRPALRTALDDADADVRTHAAGALAGRRNDPAFVEALVRRLAVEPDAQVRDAIRDGLFELTFERPADGQRAADWWARHRDEFARWWFVEAERVFGVEPVIGGFFGNQAKAFGRQCVARGWGGNPADLLEVPLEATADGKRSAWIRYARGDAAPSAMHLRLRRGEKTVFEKRDVKVRRTRDWQTFGWLKVPLGDVPAGRYWLELRTDGHNVDVDLIGWK